VAVILIGFILLLGWASSFNITCKIISRIVLAKNKTLTRNRFLSKRSTT
jgi:hypothetical protein